MTTNQPFTIRQANEWFCGSGTAPKMLFDQFWFEGELCILFADSNVGKSILAVQIADSLSRGTSIGPFVNQMEPCRVLYLDFEHSPAQFETRYTSPDGMHQFSPAFFRAELGIDTTATESTDPHQYIREAIERSVMQTGAQMLVIDNITYLFKQNGSASDALLLIKHLKALKSKYGLSILALAHTPNVTWADTSPKTTCTGAKCSSTFATAHLPSVVN